MSHNSPTKTIQTDYVADRAVFAPLPLEEMQKERAAMQQFYPEATLKKLDSDEKPFGWYVGISMDNQVHAILIVYDREYPDSEIEVYLVDPEFNIDDTPNINSDGLLEFENYEWKDNSTAATGVSLAAGWLQAVTKNNDSTDLNVEPIDYESVETVSLDEDQEK